MSHVNIWQDLDFSSIRDRLMNALPARSYRRIFIKPNWVLHQEHPEFPVDALVTDSRLLDLVISVCLKKYPTADSITVGDVPLQSCEFEKLSLQAGLDSLRAKYAVMEAPKVQFLDLRRERYKTEDGFLQLESGEAGDPRGYREVNLDRSSLLEEISANAGQFRVSDYDPEETLSVHSRGRHTYLISGSVLESELFINMPKMKTHQKAGITGALKNLVGINGAKQYLVHHQRGRPSQGGDEFPEAADTMVVFQTRVREMVQKRSSFLFRPLRIAWRIAKKLTGVKTVGTRQNLSGRFYVGSGSWYGNDSVWRMVYDLNRIIRYAPVDGGVLSESPQRDYVCVLDGLTAGEGNGPLQPLPVKTGVIVVSENPFLVDFAMSKLMGFDYRKIRLLEKYQRFPSTLWTDFHPDSFEVRSNDSVSTRGLGAIEVIHRFEPPPGWKNHIELDLVQSADAEQHAKRGGGSSS